jgi:hypothetical protein
MLSLASPVFANPEVIPVTPTERVEARNERMIQRLEEIKAMDVSTMSRKEKRALRKEVKHIEKSLNTSGGIYISAGALLVIIILLIILL